MGELNDCASIREARARPARHARHQPKLRGSPRPAESPVQIHHHLKGDTPVFHLTDGSGIIEARGEAEAKPRQGERNGKDDNFNLRHRCRDAKEN